ncbi:glycosyltransferase family 4 protein [Bacillus alkalisoli]|uniref:glycosyltransferase family 4 protein n=1 Tax=Bacillus alkalisoli TaxID=2011008 RepID=UPI0018E27514|nr:glycosyltransferase family 4 protein [Bacillus alkalisoli]
MSSTITTMLQPSYEQKRKILILSSEYPPNMEGGLGTHVEGLSSFLAKDYVVHVITPNILGAPSYQLYKEVHVHRVDTINNESEHLIEWIGQVNIAIVEKVLELRSEHSFQLIHAHDWLVGYAAITLKVECNVPLIITIHSTEYGRSKVNGFIGDIQHKINEIESLLLKKSDKIIVCSKGMLDEVCFIEEVKGKTTIIPNGIQIEEQNRSSSNPSYLEKKKVVLAIGRLVPEKGFQHLVQAAAIVSNQIEDVLFVLAGVGPMKKNLEKQVKRLGLESSFLFVGYVKSAEKKALIQSSDVVVIPSLYEPFGIVAIEAMKERKPVIAASIGGLKSIIKHEHDGLLVECTNRNELAQAISRILHNEQESATFGEHAYEKVRIHYSWKRVITLTKSVYNHVLR